MRSIERHLVARLLAVVLGLSALAGALVYAYARSRFTRAFDRALVAEAGRLEGMVVGEGPGRLGFDAVPGDLRAFEGGHHHARYYQIWTSADQPFRRSPSLGSGDLPRDLPGGRDSMVRDLVLPDGRPGRAVTVRFSPHVDEDEPQADVSVPPARWLAGIAPLTLSLAVDRHELDQTLRTLGTALLLAAAALAAGTAAAVLLTVRRGLRPLRVLGERADRIGAASLDRRFPTDGMPAELRPIVGQLNRLLGRLHEAFARERRFNADVAHELRTPVAELRAAAEVALQWPDAASLEGACRDALQIAGHMEAIVNALLAIARCEAGALAPPAPLDLATIVAEAWRRLLPAAVSARGVVARLELPECAVIAAHRPMLASLVDNVLSNAFAYTPAGGTIECRIAPAGEASLEWTVRNTCEGLDDDDLAHLFEPFWRKDAARSPGAHCGLGLCLVAAYGRALGAEPAVRLTADGQFQFTMMFSTASADPAAADPHEAPAAAAAAIA